jgi:hypothetical protein
MTHPRRLFVVFRGTVSRRQMEDNLNYARKEVNLFDHHLNALDSIDGLTPEPNAKLQFHDVNGLLEAVHEPIDLIQGNRRRHGSHSKSSDHDDEDRISIVENIFGVVPPRHHDEDPEHETAYHLHTQNNTPRATNHNFLRDTFVGGATAVERGVNVVASNLKGATSSVIDATTGAVVGAASMAPGLKSILRTCIHRGFWEAYETTIRVFVHATLRKELAREAADVIFTGHSLGGAMATFAAVDFTIHSLPRIKSHLKHAAADAESNNPSQLRSQVASIHVSMYNFGAPKVGNSAFIQTYDRILPDSFRVVVDGDLVTGLPVSWNYRHIGTPVYIDSGGTGSIIVDPSFVELWLRIQTRASIANHSLLVYHKGLLGVKAAAKYIAELAGQKKYDMKTFIRLSIFSERNISNSADANAAAINQLTVARHESKDQDVLSSSITPFQTTITSAAAAGVLHEDELIALSRQSSHSNELNEEIADETMARHLANDVRNLDFLLTNMKQGSSRREKKPHQRARALSSASGGEESSHADDNLSWKIFPKALRPVISSADRSPMSHQSDAIPDH